MLTVVNGIDQVNERLYVGGDPMYCRNLAADIDLLNENVDLIIDCRSTGERYNGWNEEEGVSVPVLHIPMHDDWVHENSVDDFIHAWNRVNEMIEAEELPVNPTLFVHCHMGVNRGPSMAMFWLIVEHEMTAKEAFLALREAREGVGIAYAGLAAMAAIELIGNQEVVDPSVWDAWERDYWWRNNNGADVKARINQNRGRFTNQNVVTDDRGIVHVTQGGES